MARLRNAAKKDTEFLLARRQLERRQLPFRYEEGPTDILLWIGNATQPVAYDAVTGKLRRDPGRPARAEDFPEVDTEFLLR